jgi:hypothetical protein
MGDCRYSSTILKLRTRWKWVVRFTRRPLCPGEIDPFSRYPLDRRLVGPRYVILPTENVVAKINKSVRRILEFPQQWLSIMCSATYSPLNVNRLCGGSFRLNIQGRISQARIHREAGSKQSRASGWILAWLIRTWILRRHVSSKRRLTFSGLHGIASQNTELVKNKSDTSKSPPRIYVYCAYTLKRSSGCIIRSISVIFRYGCYLFLKGWR